MSLGPRMKKHLEASGSPARFHELGYTYFCPWNFEAIEGQLQRLTRFGVYDKHVKLVVFVYRNSIAEEVQRILFRDPYGMKLLIQNPS